jgi:hypothetical protein
MKNQGKGDERGENEVEEGRKVNAGKLWYVGGLLGPVSWI